MQLERHAPVCAALVIALSASPTGAAVSGFCTAGGDGRSTLGFDLKPSMVVHSAAVLDATRGELGLDGEAADRAFSFSRTIGALLESASAPADAAAQEAFVQTMLYSFRSPTGRMLNAEAGIFMPVDDRPEEAALSASAMLDDDGAQGMVPLALFNRFDLAPETWSHCGEHRIVYGLKRPEPDSPADRFLLIFEAMVPNPSPEAGEAGCRRVTEFWAGLSGMGEIEQAAALSAFYYDGTTGHADGDLSGPVVHFRNYGGDGNRGQVRANMFMEFNWQLREWLTQLTFAESGPALAFLPVTVKDNPLSQLFRDDLAADADVMAGNVPAAVTALHGDFVKTLTSDFVPNLMSEGSRKYGLLLDGLDGLDLGASPVDETAVLLGTIGLGAPDRFNEHQSTSQGGVDVPGEEPAGASVAISGLLDAAGAALGTASIPGQNGQTILNRAAAVTCGGCHMTAARSSPGHFGGPGAVIRENVDASVVRWPDVHANGFVHVNEADRALSPALEEEFLPFRRYVMGRHLCADLDAGAAPEEPGGEVPDPYALVLERRGVDVPEVATDARYLEAVVQDYLGGIGRGRETVGLVGASLEAMTEGLSDPERQGLRLAVSRAIEAAREIELVLTEGAYVETRRPH
ncbi:hypothetical protein U5903_04445 [Cereibacter johrii]|uniref:hypothetical protein n=1 Tax=Cereibacter johrii TaxID=445629 RepID=UPI002B25D2F9|nr:hypothetical protein [Cereibacter johrii]MEA5160017.1 hypothetical protein [Cereibacter johrii]